MTPGLLAAQVSHISMLFLQKHVELDLVPHALETLSKKSPYHGWEAVALRPVEVEWIKQPYIAVLAVDNFEELLEVSKMAKSEGLPVVQWSDPIPSKVLEGRVIDCLVGISIGPADSDALRKATGTLPLY
jgi:peptidyl-tRNA hydrolase